MMTDNINIITEIFCIIEKIKYPIILVINNNIIIK